MYACCHIKTGNINTNNAPKFCFNKRVEPNSYRNFVTQNLARAISDYSKDRDP